MENIKQSQSAKQAGTQIQVAGDLVINQSPEEIKAQVIKVFHENFPKLTEMATNEVEKRVISFTEKLFQEIAQEGPEVIKKFSDPDIQYSLLTAQTAYARSGKEYHESLLIGLLKDKLKTADSDLKSFAISEALGLVGKILPEHLNILALLLLFLHTSNSGIILFPQLTQYLKSTILPFGDFPDKHSHYQYLSAIGCATLNSLTTTNITRVLKETYPSAFFQPCPLESLTDRLREESVRIQLFQNSAQGYVLIRNKSGIDQVLNNIGKNEKEQKQVIQDIKGRLEPDETADAKIAAVVGPDFITKWNDTPMNKMTLTSTGILLASYHYKNILSREINFADWI